MVQLTHEVWEDDKHGVVMFPRGAKGWKELLGPNAKLLHTFEAGSVYEAYKTHHRLMGWSEWVPQPGVPDKIFTEADKPD
jgi:hypothetical protein